MAAVLAACVVVNACGDGPAMAELDADNPVVPLSPPPVGMEEFFADAPVAPDPVRVRLGRWLFHDVRLSIDGTVSCATCHQSRYGFSEPRPVSVGVGGRVGTRKAPSILNLAARTTLVDTPGPERGLHYFWDGRVRGLEAQVVVPIADPREMGLDHEAMVGRVSSLGGYRPFFQEAYGSPDVTLERVAAALADYVRTLRSGNAPYDRWRYLGDARSMSAQAQEGSDVFFFKGRCAMCHAGFNFSDGRYYNLGIGWDAGSGRFADEGRAAVTGQPRDRGAFKTPSLREVARRAPYMHDGSLASLRDVVEFYNRGGNANPWRSARLSPLGLAETEMDALLAFLAALNGDVVQDSGPRRFPQ